MKLTQLSLIATFALSSAFAGGTVEPVEVTETIPVEVEEKSDLEISANLAITSNYVWRGMTQTSSSPAVQGGIDLGYKGFYLGTWGSNVEFGDTNNNLEADFYAGYATEVMGIGFDVGIIQYAYPNDSDALNFEEAYIALSKDFGSFGVNAKYSFGLDEAPDDIEVGASVALPADFGLEASYGEYDTYGERYSVALTKSFGKFDLSVGYYDFTSEYSESMDEDYVVGTISTSF
jgi:uncharacterized protein (TIGR02001 family)